MSKEEAPIEESVVRCVFSCFSQSGCDLHTVIRYTDRSNVANEHSVLNQEAGRLENVKIWAKLWSWISIYPMKERLVTSSPADEAHWCALGVKTGLRGLIQQLDIHAGPGLVWDSSRGWPVVRVSLTRGTRSTGSHHRSGQLWQQNAKMCGLSISPAGLQLLRPPQIFVGSTQFGIKLEQWPKRESGTTDRRFYMNQG